MVRLHEVHEGHEVTCHIAGVVSLELSECLLWSDPLSQSVIKEISTLLDMCDTIFGLEDPDGPEGASLKRALQLRARLGQMSMT